MELEAAGAKVSKYAVRESGDTLEIVERPHGGLSFVLVDGQHTGHGAKAISNLVARKAISMLAEGVRDGSAARAAHDYLYTHYEGKVSAELDIVSIDLVSKSIVISRNSHCPVIVADAQGIRLLQEASEAIGVHRWMKPVISELPLAPQTTLVVYTDGILDAGSRYGEPFDIKGFVAGRLYHSGGQAGSGETAQQLADAILARAVELDHGRPEDDSSVLVVRVLSRAGGDEARRVTVRFPIN
jgi:serine phosphatase RsbU (regulator of sigma subunit)